jgi:hypothetical protein
MIGKSVGDVKSSLGSRGQFVADAESNGGESAIEQGLAFHLEYLAVANVD